MAFNWLIQGVIMVLELGYTIIYPLHSTLNLIVQAREGQKVKYKDFVQWGSYWVLYAIVAQLADLVRYLPDVLHVFLAFCKVLALIWLAHPQLHGALILYTYFFEDPLFRQHVKYYRAQVTGAVSKCLASLYGKYRVGISQVSTYLRTGMMCESSMGVQELAKTPKILEDTDFVVLDS